MLLRVRLVLITVVFLGVLIFCLILQNGHGARLGLARQDSD